MLKGIRGLVLIAFLSLTILAMMFTSCSSQPSQYSLSTSSSPSEGGQVTLTSGKFDKLSQVDIKASPASGYRFDHWGGSVSGTSPSISVLMDGNKEITAFFTKTYTVAVSSSPAAGGSITPGNGTYDSGQQVTLVAAPANGYKFTGWSGDVSGATDHLTVTLDSNKQIVASFVENTCSLTAQVEPSSGGTVNSGNETFQIGNTAVITATPTKGYRFDHWGGNAAGSTNPVSILMDTNKTVTAYFTKVYTLSISSSSPNGTVNVTPDTRVFDAGTTATLTAVTSVFPFALDRWSGTDDNTVNPTTVTMNSDKSVTAYFKQLTTTDDEIVQSQVYLPVDKPTKIKAFQLQAGQWVQGQFSGSISNLSAQIIDSNNNVVQDLGQSSFIHFQAVSTGSYYLVVISDYSTHDYYYFTLEFTIYK